MLIVAKQMDIVGFHCVFILWASLFFFSCEDHVVEELLVYDNEFSTADLTNIENGRLNVFDGNSVLGFYHNDEVKLKLSDLPRHNTIKVIIDLMVHDSWDGNPDNIGGPDFWYLHLDGVEIIRTTFSNSPCESLYCLYQSYPDNYPRFNDPKTGASATNLPGRCQYANSPGWTTLYQITRLINHSSSEIEITLGDELRQENAPDPECDESWSISRIQVSTMTIN